MYASIAADGAIPDMEKIFGARVADTLTASEVTLKVIEPFGDLKPGDTFHYAVPSQNPRYWGALLEVMGGKVIAIDQDGHPGLVTNTLGSGKTLLCAYPGESYLAAAQLPPLKKAENSHRIYQTFQVGRRIEVANSSFFYRISQRRTSWLRDPSESQR